jgi:hypothetical protein
MLVLLSNTRKKLLWLWLIATAIIMLLILMQTLMGVYEDIIGTAWMWAFVNLLPSLVLLYVVTLLNKNAAKLVLKSIFQSVYFGALAYLFCMFFFLIARPLAPSDQSIEAYLRMSYTLLMPFQILLLLIFSILYFKKEPLFLPNAAIIKDYTTKKAEMAQGKGNLKQEQAFSLLLEEPDLSKVLSFLHANLKEDTNDIVLMQSQYTTWQREKNLNLSSPDVLQRRLNNMTLAVSNYIEKL